MNISSFIPTVPLKTAVLFLIFNRPDTTQQVFDAIRMARPPRLYIAADGPRDHIAGERAKVELAREAILKKIDWDCDVKTLFRERNLGCKYAVSSGIDWFFEHEEMGIILEDDCLPSQSFFWFCQELLERYRNDERISIISGDNFLVNGNFNINNSYYFSMNAHIWGWATWKYNWNLYDVEMNQWPDIKKKCLLLNKFKNKQIYRHWERIFDSVYNKQIDTWDIQLFFCGLIQNKLSILPHLNLVKNIGFNDNATHTRDSNDICSNMKINNIHFSLKHPDYIIQNYTADEYVFYISFKRTIFSKIQKKLKSIFRNL